MACSVFDGCFQFFFDAFQNERGKQYPTINVVDFQLNKYVVCWCCCCCCPFFVSCVWYIAKCDWYVIVLFATLNFRLFYDPFRCNRETWFANNKNAYEYKVLETVFINCNRIDEVTAITMKTKQMSRNRRDWRKPLPLPFLSINRIAFLFNSRPTYLCMWMEYFRHIQLTYHYSNLVDTQKSTHAHTRKLIESVQIKSDTHEQGLHSNIKRKITIFVNRYIKFRFNQNRNCSIV